MRDQQNNSVPAPCLRPRCFSFTLFCIPFFISLLFLLCLPPPADTPSFTLIRILSPFCQPLFSPFDLLFQSYISLHSLYSTVLDILIFPVGEVNPSGQLSGKPGQNCPRSCLHVLVVVIYHDDTTCAVTIFYVKYSGVLTKYIFFWMFGAHMTWIFWF